MRRVIGRPIVRAAFSNTILLFLSVALIAGTASPQGVSGTTTLITDAGYVRLLDTIFPRESPVPLKVAYTMILRFEPNEGPESQLLFRAWNDGHVDAELYSVKDGSAWSAANNYIAKSGGEDIAAIAPSIPVEKKQLTIPANKIQQWHAGLFDSLRSSDSALEKSAAAYAKDGSREAVLDGTRYQFWYLQGEAEMRWNFSDIDINDAPARANLPLARWMNMVRMASLRQR